MSLFSAIVKIGLGVTVFNYFQDITLSLKQLIKYNRSCWGTPFSGKVLPESDRNF